MTTIIQPVMCLTRYNENARHGKRQKSEKVLDTTERKDKSESDKELDVLRIDRGNKVDLLA